MRMRCRRGVALAWALLALLVVTIAATAIADGLARRARLVRQQADAAARVDLERAGRALQRQRLRDARWTGPETLELAGGSVVVGRDEIRVRTRLTGR